jgi:hypothetical protein
MDINKLYSDYCNLFWVHFSDGAYSNRKTVTFQQWQQRTPAARKAMLRHLATNGAPKKNPFFWVQDFPEPQPHNLNGARSLPDEPLVRAVHNGVGGIFTRAEAELYNMQIKGEFKL